MKRMEGERSVHHLFAGLRRPFIKAMNRNLGMPLVPAFNLGAVASVQQIDEQVTTRLRRQACHLVPQQGWGDAQSAGRKVFRPEERECMTNSSSGDESGERLHPPKTGPWARSRRVRRVTRHELVSDRQLRNPGAPKPMMDANQGFEKIDQQVRPFGCVEMVELPQRG